MQKLKEEKPWFVDWFDENYRMLYRHRNSAEAREQVHLIINTLKPSKTAAILDLCCGEARYTDIFRKLGYRIFGLDLSETLIRFGKEKDPDLNLMVGDMRHIPGHYDFIFSLFTSFGYFETDEENLETLQSVYAALNNGGVYWLDFFNPLFVEKNLVPETHSVLPQGIEILEKRNVSGGRIIKDIHFKYINKKDVANEENDAVNRDVNGDVSGEKVYQESVRLFTRECLEGMFMRTGFTLLHCFGDYDGSVWTPESERTILVGRKEL